MSVVALLLTVYFYVPPTEVANPTLDVSNYVSYAHFTATGAHYGKDVLPVVGPFGFVMYGHTYGGQLFGLRTVLEGALKLSFAGLILWFLGRISSWWIRGLWLSTLLLLAPSVGDASYDLLVVLAGLFLLFAQDRNRIERFALISVTALLAFMALIKGTQLSLSLLTLSLVAASVAWTGQRSKLAVITVTFAVMFPAWWLLAGQNVFHLPRFLHAVFDLSRGYNAAMGLQEEPHIFRTGLGALLALSAMTGGLAVISFRNKPLMAAAILLGAFTFLSWKHGFVRADGHVFIFYRYAGVIAVTVFALGQFLRPDESLIRPIFSQTLLSITGLIAFGFGMVGDGRAVLPSWRHELGRIPHLVQESARFLSNPAARKRNLEAQIETNRARFSLPRVSARVGDASIDFFGSEHGFIPLNGLDYHPRPMGGGSFCVFSPWLQSVNAAFVADPTTAAQFYLANINPIDNRFATQDDSQALLELLRHYSPTDLDQGMLLLERRPESTSASKPRLLQKVSAVKFDDWVELPEVGPDEMVLVSFEVTLTWLGKLKEFAYKPPILYLSIQGQGITEGSYRRLIPSMVTQPTLLAPFIETTTDLLELYGDAPGKLVNRLQINSPQPGLWRESDLKLSFFVSPRPMRDNATVQRLRELAAFPIGSRAPVTPVPSNHLGRTPDGQPILVMHPPGVLDFKLNGDERILSLGYGIEQAAWSEGETDGVSLVVELVDPNAGTLPVFRRHLDPKTKEADRGYQNSTIPLPPVIPTGSLLRVRSDPGASGNGAWDWFFVANLLITSGAFDAQQFAGFQTIPIAVAGANCGTMEYEGAPVFMLNAPAYMDFKLRGDASHLTFDAGFIAGAYTNGQTDGANYVWEFLDEEGQPSEISRRFLNPYFNPDDRGSQSFDIAIPPHPPDQILRLRIDPGPTGNAAWDWTYVANLKLQ